MKIEIVACHLRWLRTLTLPLTLLSTLHVGHSHDCITTSAAYFPEPLPGVFMGTPTAPGDGCFVASSSATCSNISDTVFTDGAVGDETGSLLPASFHAWSESSGFSLTHSTTTVRQVKLFFYHKPSMGIGLPQFSLSASGSPIIPGSSPLQYTILGNQDLSEDDATVRNVTLALTTTQSNGNLHIKFSMTNEIHQFAISEVKLCSGEATIEVEALSLVLHSEPLSRPNIFLPVDTTQHPPTANLSCTVANQGRFQWQWTLQDSSSPSSVWVSDGTRSSAIEIPLGTDAVGDYTCTATYHPDIELHEEGGDEGSGPISIRVDNEMKKMILETDNKKRTPLHLATKNGHYKVVAMLIKICREAIKCRDMHEDMALHLACRKGHLNVVKEIMEWEPTTIGPKYVNTKGETAIHCAAYNSLDSGALMEYLLGVCKDSSTLDIEDILNLHEGRAKHTPLMLACTKGRPEIVKVLLHHGADVSQQEGKGQGGGDQGRLNSLELAIENGRREVTKVIVDKNRKDWKRGMRAGNIIYGIVNTPFRRMIRKMPDVAMLVLNNCTKEKNDRDNVDFAMTFDYEFVEDFQSGIKKEAPGASNSTFSNVETDSGHAQASNKMFDDAERDSADVFLGEDDVDGVQLKEVVTCTDGGKRTALRDAETDSADVHLCEDDADGALLKTCTGGEKITPRDTKGNHTFVPYQH